jgi:acyl phosphate:glycerol-3-phosphate acyltransferase
MLGTLTSTQVGLVAVALLVSGYAIGGIPWALLIGKWVKGIDLRTVGSGNLGATNVARSLGGTWAVLVFFLDFAKGMLPVAAAVILTPDANHDLLMMAGAVGAVLGHVYSPYIGFRGGKGIAVTAGATAVANPWCLLVGTVLFFAVALSTRRVSVGSLVIGIAYPPLVLLFYPGRPFNLAFSVAVCALVFWSHRANIGRLLRGEEQKVSWGIFKND